MPLWNCRLKLDFVLLERIGCQVQLAPPVAIYSDLSPDTLILIYYQIFMIKRTTVVCTSLLLAEEGKSIILWPGCWRHQHHQLWSGFIWLATGRTTVAHATSGMLVGSPAAEEEKVHEKRLQQSFCINEKPGELPDVSLLLMMIRVFLLAENSSGCLR